MLKSKNNEERAEDDGQTLECTDRLEQDKLLQT